MKLIRSQDRAVQEYGSRGQWFKSIAIQGNIYFPAILPMIWWIKNNGTWFIKPKEFFYHGQNKKNSLGFELVLLCLV